MQSFNESTSVRKPALKAVATSDAPAAIGPYSQAIEVGGLLFVSGQLPLPADGGPMPSDVAEQARVSLRNIAAIARSAGCTLGDVVKFTVYMTDLSGFAQVNDVMVSMLQAPYPARATVEVAALPKAAAIEIDAILALPASKE